MSYTIQWIGGRLGDSNVREMVDTWEDALQTCEIYTYLDNSGELFEIAHIYNDDGSLAGVYELDPDEPDEDSEVIYGDA